MSQTTIVTVTETDFAEVVQLIGQARQKASRSVNAELIALYWAVGEYISKKIIANAWGKATVTSLAAFIQLQQPGQRGFSAQNIWRMRQFYEAYCDQPKLSTLLRELPWSSHLHILSRSKGAEVRELYFQLAIQERRSSRELERQFNTALFERMLLNPVKESAALTQTHPRHSRVLLSGIQRRCWAPTPHLLGGRLFAGMTTPRIAA